jgi:hypothetical protein
VPALIANAIEPIGSYTSSAGKILSSASRYFTLVRLGGIKMCLEQSIARSIVALSVLSAAFQLSGCGSRPTSAAAAKVSAMKQRIQVGMPREDVRRILTNSGLEHSFDPDTNTFLAIERNVNAGALTAENKQLVVTCDNNGTVLKVDEKSIFTGP